MPVRHARRASDRSSTCCARCLLYRGLSKGLPFSPPPTPPPWQAREEAARQLEDRLARLVAERDGTAAGLRQELAAALDALDALGSEAAAAAAARGEELRAAKEAAGQLERRLAQLAAEKDAELERVGRELAGAREELAALASQSDATVGEREGELRAVTEEALQLERRLVQLAAERDAEVAALRAELQRSEQQVGWVGGWWLCMGWGRGCDNFGAGAGERLVRCWAVKAAGHAVWHARRLKQPLLGLAARLLGATRFTCCPTQSVCCPFLLLSPSVRALLTPVTCQAFHALLTFPTAPHNPCIAGPCCRWQTCRARCGRCGRRRLLHRWAALPGTRGVGVTPHKRTPGGEGTCGTHPASHFTRQQRM